MPGTTWRIFARVRGAGAAEAMFSLLDEASGAASAFEIARDEWQLDAYPQSPVLNQEFRARLLLAATAARGAVLEIDQQRLPDRDWLRDNQLAFPPLRVGRFFIYGSHYRGPVPGASIGIMVDAATAFGTGEHPSTRACLLALDRLARRRRFRNPLDIGTGTGILSIAAAKLLRRKVIASEIDPGAVDVARHNLARNGVARLVRVRRASGYRDRVLRQSRHDLILSNILARPIAGMACDLARTLAPGGRAVLSGLLRWQEPIVLAPHRACGIVLDHRLVIDGWSTLVMRRRQRRHITRAAEAPSSANECVRPALAGQASRSFGTGSGANPNRSCERYRRGR